MAENCQKLIGTGLATGMVYWYAELIYIYRYKIFIIIIAYCRIILIIKNY